MHGPAAGGNYWGSRPPSSGTYTNGCQWSVIQRDTWLLAPARILQRGAERVSDLFPARWPDTLSNTPETAMLWAVRDFLNGPERHRKRANDTYLESELRDSQEFFDRVEARPLTGEQRRAVATDDDRNLLIAPAGSGKTSVIVAKAGWLVAKGYQKPSEILLLAFARDARNELGERVRSRLGEDVARGIAVRTFHSLGMAIIGEVEGQRPSLAKAADDDLVLNKMLGDILSELLAERSLSRNLVKWFEGQFAPYRSALECRSWGEYWDYIRRFDIRTLKGEKVKSFEECEIANFLYLNGVAYEYEASYEHETATPEKRQYCPDFHLPEDGIYIEHFGINASGGTAPYVDRDEYVRSMEWKRALHEQHGTDLIETFSHERSAGTLIDNLAGNLARRGVSMSPIPDSEVFDVLNSQGRVDPFIRLLAEFLHHFKGSQLSFRDVVPRAAHAVDRVRATAFLEVFWPVYERYESRLSDQGEIDFHDMIDRAADHVEKGRYRSPFRYFLVDEFQDISLERARLLKALLDGSPNARLFAVGDDWQSIFRFTGSDISVMRHFGERFGAAERIDLETTFRCPDRIAEAATRFILRNPLQIRKSVRSIHNADGLCVHVGLAGGDGPTLLSETLGRIAADAGGQHEKRSVLLLGRYRRLRPRNLSNLARQYPGLDLSFMTVHGSKGLQADYVVVLGLCSGLHGFPSEIEDDPLLDLILAEPEEYPNAEERRLFYVAMTRAKRQVFLLAEGGPPSPFVWELIDGDYEVGVFGPRPAKDVPCPACVEGRLERRASRRNEGAFYGCSNWPYCKYTQPPCPDCGSGFLIEADGRFRCRDCGAAMEGCPACDGWLEPRMGQYGRFLGCSTWPACSYTRDLH